MDRNKSNGDGLEIYLKQYGFVYGRRERNNLRKFGHIAYSADQINAGLLAMAQHR